MLRSAWKGALAGGVVLFVWGFVSWTILPWHDMTLSTFADEDEVARVVRANASGRGIYLYPGERHEPGMTPEEVEAAKQAVVDKMRRGPFLFVSYVDRGTASMAGPLIIGFVCQVFGALALTLIVLFSRERRFWNRVSIVVLVAVAASALCYLPQWNWFGFADGYTRVAILDLVAATFLAGMAIAKVTPVPD